MSKIAEQPVDFTQVLGDLVAGKDLSRAAAGAVLDEVMAGDVEPAVIAAWLVALQAKGVVADEIAGSVETMVANAQHVPSDGLLLDTCGTGGDGASTLNVSTLGALVAATGGVPVAKHGNRAASGTCGAADVLEAWGLAIDLGPKEVAITIDELGIGFMFARTFHPAMRHVAPVRAMLGIPTIFNVLGPLSNPAGASHQLVGVADAKLAPIMAEALARLGRRAMVVRGHDGLDELTITGPSDTWTVIDGTVEQGTFDPVDVGIDHQPIDGAVVGSVEEAVAAADAVLDGAEGSATDLVVLNAGAALFVAEAVESIGAGVQQARELLASGKVRDLRDRWVERSQQLAAG